MKIELEFDKQELEIFLIAVTKDKNITKYSEENFNEVVKNTLSGYVYETIANFEIQQSTEIAKQKMTKWLLEKIKAPEDLGQL